MRIKSKAESPLGLTTTLPCVKINEQACGSYLKEFLDCSLVPFRGSEDYVVDIGVTL